MAFTYKEAFGLTDNPFGPRKPFGKVPPNLTFDLDKRPLLLHRDTRLADLYCATIPSFAAACADFETLLEAEGYTLNPPSRGTSSYLVAIEGDRGAGKTTLACRLTQVMQERTAPGDPPWQTEEIMLQSSRETATEQADRIKAFQAKIAAANPAPQYLCVIVDDLLAEAFPYATALFDSLRNIAVVFMVFTSCDSAMTAQIDRTLHRVQRFKIGSLSPDDAIAYVAARYKIFRLPSANGINAEPLFPFDENDIRTAVAVRVVSGVTGPVTLRLVGSVLASALTNRLQEIARDSPGFDVTAVPVSKLPELKIRIAQAYKIVVRK